MDNDGDRITVESVDGSGQPGTVESEIYYLDFTNPDNSGGSVNANATTILGCLICGNIHYGVYIHGTQNALYNTTIEWDEANNSTGICIEKSSATSIMNCYFEQNKTTIKLLNNAKGTKIIGNYVRYFPTSRGEEWIVYEGISANPSRGNSAFMTTKRNADNDTNEYISSIMDLKVGIGTTEPKYKLDVFASTNIEDVLYIPNNPQNPGLDDAVSGGTFTGQVVDIEYKVQIDGTGTTDTFKWTDDGGDNWTENVPIPDGGAWQELSNGVGISFAAKTGHTLNNRWEFTACISNLLQLSDTENNSLMSVKNDGNVGIGTTDPGSKLVVSSGETGPVDLLIEADTSGQGSESYQPSLTLSQDGGAVQGKLGFFNSENDLTLKNIYSQGSLHLGTNNSKKVTIDKDGNVGIGTTSPQTKLHIFGDESQELQLLHLENGYSTYPQTILKITANEVDGRIIAYDSASTPNMKIGTNSNHELRLITNNYIRVMVQSGGNVGIGNNNPHSKLQVDGGVQVGNDSDSASADKAGTFRYRTDATYSYLEVCMRTGTGPDTYQWVELLKKP